MKTSEKKNLILKALYEQGLNGECYDVGKLLSSYTTFKAGELRAITKSLADADLIKMTSTREAIYVELTADGAEYIEDNIDDSSRPGSYQPMDNFSDSEKDTILDKLNDLTDKLKEIQLGQEVTYEDLRAELQEMKQLLNVLGKKHWFQVLKGKMIDAGLGSLSGEAFSVLLDAFNEGAPLLNSTQ
jgi:DNA-binding MarR family transcriptional regulator